MPQTWSGVQFAVRGHGECALDIHIAPCPQEQAESPTTVISTPISETSILESATQFLPGLNLESWGVVLSFFDDICGLLQIARERR